MTNATNVPSSGPGEPLYPVVVLDRTGVLQDQRWEPVA